LVEKGSPHCPNGRSWLPELRPLPAPIVFEPWTLTPMEQTVTDIRLGPDYPLPVVDAAETRQRALAQSYPLRQEVAAAEDLTPYINRVPGVTSHLVERDRPVDQPESPLVAQPA
jgi:deoxyribodipyrimidine photo-lyase